MKHKEEVAGRVVARKAGLRSGLCIGTKLLILMQDRSWSGQRFLVQIAQLVDLLRFHLLGN